MADGLEVGLPACGREQAKRREVIGEGMGPKPRRGPGRLKSRAAITSVMGGFRNPPFLALSTTISLAFLDAFVPSDIDPGDALFRYR